LHCDALSRISGIVAANLWSALNVSERVARTVRKNKRAGARRARKRARGEEAWSHHAPT